MFSCLKKAPGMIYRTKILKALPPPHLLRSGVLPAQDLGFSPSFITKSVCPILAATPSTFPQSFPLSPRPFICKNHARRTRHFYKLIVIYYAPTLGRLGEWYTQPSGHYPYDLCNCSLIGGGGGELLLTQDKYED